MSKMPPYFSHHVVNTPLFYQLSGGFADFYCVLSFCFFGVTHPNRCSPPGEIVLFFIMWTTHLRVFPWWLQISFLGCGGYILLSFSFIEVPRTPFGLKSLVWVLATYKM